MGRNVPFIIVTILISGVLKLHAQTCCSGGVPLSGTLGLPTGAKGSWQFNISYDLNLLRTLKIGTETLDDDSRLRTTHSGLVQVGYNFTDRLAADVLVSYVRQERTITQIDRPSNFLATNGLGDAVLLLKYKVVEGIQLGVGTKAPTGPADLVREDGIPLAADLQAGSGAWDAVLWGNFSKQISSRKTLTLSNNTVYRFTGKNKEYLGVSTYEFGNELQTTFILADQWLVGNSIVSPSIGVKYRRQDEDRINDQIVPSTGGQWIFFKPGIQYFLFQSMALQVNAELPLLSDIIGTQLTPTLRINAGIYIRLDKKQPLSINPLFDSSTN